MTREKYLSKYEKFESSLLKTLNDPVEFFICYWYIDSAMATIKPLGGSYKRPSCIPILFNYFVWPPCIITAFAHSYVTEVVV